MGRRIAIFTSCVLIGGLAIFPHTMLCQASDSLLMQSDSIPKVRKAYNPFEVIRKANVVKTENPVVVPPPPPRKPLPEIAEDTTSSDDSLEIVLDSLPKEAIQIEDLSGSEIDTSTADVSMIDTAGVESILDRFTPAASWDNTVVFGLLLFSILLLTFLININRHVVTNILKTIFNDNYFNLMFREYHRGDTPLLHRLLYILFFINSGLFVYLSLRQLDFLPVHLPLAFCILGITAVYLGKHMFLRLIGMIFPIEKEMLQYSYAVMIYNIFLGVTLIPINGLLAFGPNKIGNWLFFITLSIYILTYIIRQMRGLFIGSAHLLFHKFHFFLYLCTTEIAPLLILIKSVQIFS